MISPVSWSSQYYDHKLQSKSRPILLIKAVEATGMIPTNPDARWVFPTLKILGKAQMVHAVQAGKKEETVG